MPNIKGIDLSDGIKILSGEVNTADAWYAKAAMIADFGNKPIAQCETIANNFLANKFPGEQIQVHIFSLSPLKVTCIVANLGVVIPSDWWVG